jgi:DNA-binding Lrp family transcriptional regulator
MTLELWDICGRKHKNNPESRAAFRQLDASQQRARVLAAVQQAGIHGLTCHELADRWNVSPHQISGRFSELKKQGAIRKRGTRINSAGNSCGVLVAN